MRGVGVVVLVEVEAAVEQTDVMYKEKKVDSESWWRRIMRLWRRCRCIWRRCS